MKKKTTGASSTLPPIILADDFIEHYMIAWRIEQARQYPNNPL